MLSTIKEQRSSYVVSESFGSWVFLVYNKNKKTMQLCTVKVRCVKQHTRCTKVISECKSTLQLIKKLMEFDNRITVQRYHSKLLDSTYASWHHSTRQIIAHQQELLPKYYEEETGVPLVSLKRRTAEHCLYSQQQTCLVKFLFNVLELARHYDFWVHRKVWYAEFGQAFTPLETIHLWQEFWERLSLKFGDIRHCTVVQIHQGTCSCYMEL